MKKQQKIISINIGEVTIAIKKAGRNICRPPETPTLPIGMIRRV